MAYIAGACLKYNDATRYSRSELADVESNAIQNHVSWCASCRGVLEEAWFDLEAAAFLVNHPAYKEEDVDICISLIQRLDELVRMGERKNSLN